MSTGLVKPLSEWLSGLASSLEAFSEKEVLVVTLIGRDLLEYRKGKDLDEYLGVELFPPYTLTDSCTVEVLFSTESRTVFLIVNSVDDVPQLCSLFAEQDPSVNFFEKINALERDRSQLLVFCSIVSHVFLFIEQGCRFSSTMARTLRTVNKLRMSCTRSICTLLEEKLPDAFERHTSLLRYGRLAIPRLIFAFHRNTIRTDLGATKKREIYDKLERSLELQIYNVMKLLKIVDNGGNSLGYLSENRAYALLLPHQTDRMTELMEEFAVDFDSSDENTERRDAGDRERDRKSTLLDFLEENITSVWSDLVYAYEKPSLKDWMQIAKIVSVVLEEDNEVLDESALTQHCGKELGFLNWLAKNQLNDAVEIYTQRRDNDKAVLSKTEHDTRFAWATSYLDSVCVGNKEESMKKLHALCDTRWQRGCEYTSLTARPCQQAAHACVGDSGVDRSQWLSHSSGTNFVSACNCGHTLALRLDPFTLKEANYDFYTSSKTFPCCANLEAHEFICVDESGAAGLELEDDDAWAGQAEPRQYLDNRLIESRKKANGGGQEGAESGTDSQQSADEPAEDEGSDWDEDSVEYEVGRRQTDYLEEHGNEVNVRDPSTTVLELEIELYDKKQALKAAGRHFLEGVPRSLSSGHPPLFPSFALTCLGPSSVYSHQYGLREMPGFKPGCDYLLPYIVYLDVDSDMWQRDMNCVHELISGADYYRQKLRRKGGAIVEKVKLFVGFEYECPRGHRLFIGPDLEPLPSAKGSAKEHLSRESGADLMAQDIPVWRQCTCRTSGSTVNAQLIRVHVVTPKAPVTVTIHPKIQPSTDDTGYFHTGEPPLELSWSKYYMLRLPFVYEGPQGPVLPPNTVGSHGVFHKECISVTYQPLTPWMP